MQPTYCSDCENVHMATRKSHPAQWLCVKFPRLEGQGFVSRDEWAEQQPFMYCRGINGGACCLWTPRRNGQRELGV